jgi:hypothetical protein
MLAKQPADRPDSMDDVLAALRANRVYRSMPAAKKSEV